jgi:hypothetical protein
VNEEGQVQTTDAGMTVAVKLVEGVVGGRLASVATLPRTVTAKRELRAKTGAIAADQHSWSLARVSCERGVRVLPVRVLVDDAARDADPESRAVYHPSATYRAGGVVGALISGAGHVGRIWQIRSAAKRHAERLADFLVHLMPTLA